MRAGCAAAGGASPVNLGRGWLLFALIFEAVEKIPNPRSPTLRVGSARKLCRKVSCRLAGGERFRVLADRDPLDNEARASECRHRIARRKPILVLVDAAWNHSCKGPVVADQQRSGTLFRVYF